MLQYRLGQVKDYSLDRIKMQQYRLGQVKDYSLDRMQNATVQLGINERLQFRQNAECYSADSEK